MYFILKNATFPNTIGTITVVEGSGGSGGSNTDPNATLTINPTPSDATVTLTATGYTQSGNSITVAKGTSVAYTVSKSGYQSKNGTVTVSYTRSLGVSLVTEGGSGSGGDSGNTGFVDPRLSHPQAQSGASVPSNGIITQDKTTVLEDCWMNSTYAYLSWNPEGSGGESSSTYTDDYFYCYLPVDISQYTKIDITANNNNAAYYQFFTGDLSFKTTGGRIKVDKGTSATAQTIPDGAKYLLIAHHRIKEGAYSDYYPTAVKIYK